MPLSIQEKIERSVIVLEDYSPDLKNKIENLRAQGIDLLERLALNVEQTKELEAGEHCGDKRKATRSQTSSSPLKKHKTGSALLSSSGSDIEGDLYLDILCYLRQLFKKNALFASLESLFVGEDSSIVYWLESDLPKETHKQVKSEHQSLSASISHQFTQAAQQRSRLSGDSIVFAAPLIAAIPSAPPIPAIPSAPPIAPPMAPPMASGFPSTGCSQGTHGAAKKQNPLYRDFKAVLDSFWGFRLLDASRTWKPLKDDTSERSDFSRKANILYVKLQAELRKTINLHHDNEMRCLKNQQRITDSENRSHFIGQFQNELIPFEPITIFETLEKFDTTVSEEDRSILVRLLELTNRPMTLFEWLTQDKSKLENTTADKIELCAKSFLGLFSPKILAVLKQTKCKTNVELLQRFNELDDHGLGTNFLAKRLKHLLHATDFYQKISFDEVMTMLRSAFTGGANQLDSERFTFSFRDHIEKIFPLGKERYLFEDLQGFLQGCRAPEKESLEKIHDLLEKHPQLKESLNSLCWKSSRKELTTNFLAFRKNRLQKIQKIDAYLKEAAAFKALSENALKLIDHKDLHEEMIRVEAEKRNYCSTLDSLYLLISTMFAGFNEKGISTYHSLYKKLLAAQLKQNKGDSSLPSSKPPNTLGSQYPTWLIDYIRKNIGSISNISEGDKYFLLSEARQKKLLKNLSKKNSLFKNPEQPKDEGELRRLFEDEARDFLIEEVNDFLGEWTVQSLKDIYAVPSSSYNFFDDLSFEEVKQLIRNAHLIGVNLNTEEGREAFCRNMHGRLKFRTPYSLKELQRLYSGPCQRSSNNEIVLKEPNVLVKPWFCFNENATKLVRVSRPVSFGVQKQIVPKLKRMLQFNKVLDAAYQKSPSDWLLLFSVDDLKKLLPSNKKPTLLVAEQSFLGTTFPSIEIPVLNETFKEDETPEQLEVKFCTWLTTLFKACKNCADQLVALTDTYKTEEILFRLAEANSNNQQFFYLDALEKLLGRTLLTAEYGLSPVDSGSLLEYTFQTLERRKKLRGIEDKREVKGTIEKHQIAHSENEVQQVYIEGLLREYRKPDGLTYIIASGKEGFGRIQNKLSQLSELVSSLKNDSAMESYSNVQAEILRQLEAWRQKPISPQLMMKSLHSLQKKLKDTLAKAPSLEELVNSQIEKDKATKREAYEGDLEVLEKEKAQHAKMAKQAEALALELHEHKKARQDSKRRREREHQARLHDKDEQINKAKKRQRIAEQEAQELQEKLKAKEAEAEKLAVQTPAQQIEGMYNTQGVQATVNFVKASNDPNLVNVLRTTLFAKENLTAVKVKKTYGI